MPRFTCNALLQDNVRYSHCTVIDVSVIYSGQSVMSSADHQMLLCPRDTEQSVEVVRHQGAHGGAVNEWHTLEVIDFS